MLYLVLLHYPVMNKDGDIVATSVANMDIHDIARAARTYGVKAFYIVNPIQAQRTLAGEIVGHWLNGYGASFNKLRQEAFTLVRLSEKLTEVVLDIQKETGHKPQTIVTGANLRGNLLTFFDFNKKLKEDKLPYLLIFGTGSGIAQEVIEKADYCLEPIKGTGNYNHLAVRSAAAIILDRINNI